MSINYKMTLRDKWDVRDMRSKHWLDAQAMKGVCGECRTLWPCDAVQALDALLLVVGNGMHSIPDRSPGWQGRALLKVKS